MTSQIWYIEGFEENYCKECVKIALEEFQKEEPEEKFNVYIDHSSYGEDNESVYCELCEIELEK